MTSLIDAVGECLARLGDGNYDGSLAIIDSYTLTAAGVSDSEHESGPSQSGLHPLGVPIERRAVLCSDDSYSVLSSFSDADSFRDASSSPFWQDDTHIPFHPVDSEHRDEAAAGRAHVHTTESVLGSLRQLVERERAWAREKAANEANLAQMALQLEQQSRVHPASAKTPSAAAMVTALPLATALEPAADDIGSRFPASNSACAIVSAADEEACLECIQACERVAESIINGDFSARVKCDRCHLVPIANDAESDDAEWPMLPKSSCSGEPKPVSTPLVDRPTMHTQRLANCINRMASLLS
ncbi:hypothetical protein GGI20_003815 [Coemansia sp. BCRC 34301]|nr:hypothetical protein GGI20_003815 [Coemansia sp. BCRC 34301]